MVKIIKEPDAKAKKQKEGSEEVIAKQITPEELKKA